MYWIGPKSHKAVDFIEGDLREMMASSDSVEGTSREAVIETAVRGDRWPRDGDGD